jgi:hypothetical protein
LGAIVTVAFIYAVGYQMLYGVFVISRVGTVGAFLGLGSLIVKSVQVVWSTGNQKKENWKHLGQLASLPALCLFSGLAVSSAAWFLPKTYDLFLYAFDSTLGSPSSFVIGRLFRTHLIIGNISGYVYSCLPVYIAVFLGYQIRSGKMVADVRYLLGIIGLMGFFLYLICPAAGPLHCFQTFPDSPPSLKDLSVQQIAVAAVPRNAIPSLHFGWALLMCLYAWMRRNWLLGLGSTVFVAFTALATLGSGEHYLIDLIVAVPLVVAVLAACSAESASKMFGRELVVGMGITLAWLSCLRLGLFIGTNPVFCWSVVTLTLLISLALFLTLVKRTSVQSKRLFPVPIPLLIPRVAV